MHPTSFYASPNMIDWYNGAFNDHERSLRTIKLTMVAACCHQPAASEGQIRVIFYQKIRALYYHEENVTKCCRKIVESSSEGWDASFWQKRFKVCLILTLITKGVKISSNGRVVFMIGLQTGLNRTSQRICRTVKKKRRYQNQQQRWLQSFCWTSSEPQADPSLHWTGSPDPEQCWGSC